MKKFIATLTLTVLAFASAAVAEEVTFVAGMTGVTWNGCKKFVSSAFTKAGASNVTIENGEAAGTQKVTVVFKEAPKEEITLAKAKELMKPQDKRFVVQTWAKAEE